MPAYRVTKALQERPFKPYTTTISVPRDVLRNAIKLKGIAADCEYGSQGDDQDIIRIAMLCRVISLFGISEKMVLAWLRSSSWGRRTLNRHIAGLSPEEYARICQAVDRCDKIAAIDEMFADSHIGDYDRFVAYTREEELR